MFYATSEPKTTAEVAVKSANTHWPHSSVGALVRWGGRNRLPRFKEGLGNSALSYITPRSINCLQNKRGGISLCRISRLRATQRRTAAGDELQQAEQTAEDEAVYET